MFPSIFPWVTLCFFYIFLRLPSSFPCVSLIFSLSFPQVTHRFIIPHFIFYFQNATGCTRTWAAGCAGPAWRPAPVTPACTRLARAVSTVSPPARCTPGSSSTSLLCCCLEGKSLLTLYTDLLDGSPTIQHKIFQHNKKPYHKIYLT